jgi:hypothetical protein
VQRFEEKASLNKKEVWKENIIRTIKIISLNTVEHNES